MKAQQQTIMLSQVVDEQLQQFLLEVAPDHNFTSGLFLSGFQSRVMQANDDLAVRHHSFF